MKKLTLIALAFLLLVPCLPAETLLYTIRASGTSAPREKTVDLTPGTVFTISGSGTIQVQTGTAFLASLNGVTTIGTQTLTNKTLASPVINSPTGIVKGDVGLGNLDNTSDANKPVSTAQQTALNLKLNANSGTATNLNLAGTTQFSGTAVTPAGISLATAADAAAQNTLLWELKTSSFTAAVGGRYLCAGNFAVTNPGVVGVTGMAFQVIVLNGSVTVNGVVYSASQFPITVFSTPGVWNTLASTIAGLTVSGAGTLATAIVSGSASFNGNTTIGDASGDTLTINAGTVTAPNATGTSPSSIPNKTTNDGLYLARVQGDASVASIAMANAAFPRMTFPGTYQLANSGTAWGNWFAVTQSAGMQIGKQVGANQPPGWARACMYGWLTRAGESNATYTGRGFTIAGYPNFPGDSAAIGLATDLYFGAQLTETGGPLTARGLRVQFKGNTPTSNILITTGIHDGTSETTNTATSNGLGYAGSLVIRWLPTGGSTPGAGSKLEVWGRSEGGSTLSLLCSSTLSGSIGSTVFAGGSFAIVASSSGTTPGYTVNWELGGITYSIH